MKRLAYLCLLLFISAKADELSFQSNAPSASKRTHAIQLLSTKSLDYALKNITKVPKQYRSGIAVYQIGEYYATRYIDVFSPSSLPALINDFKKAGFLSPLTFEYNPSRIPLNTSTKLSPVAAVTLPKTEPTLSQHDKTHLIVNAQKAYVARDYSQATIYYEMMIASGIKDHQVLLNLAYLYGRDGALIQLEKLIEGKRGINDYYYAYGVGSLEAKRLDLYDSLAPQLIYDKSGKLAMLCGYFYENQNHPSKASAFYKMAYNANPNDPHILYAYARNVDIKGDKDQAIYLYTQLTQIGANFESLQSVSRSRIQEIRSTQ